MVYYHQSGDNGRVSVLAQKRSGPFYVVVTVTKIDFIAFLNRRLCKVVLKPTSTTKL